MLLMSVIYAVLKMILFVLGVVFIVIQNQPLMAQSIVLEPDINQIDPPPAATQYVNLREADVMWSRRVWRRIDLRISENLILKTDQRRNEISVNSFFNVLKNEISKGKIVAY
jgi:hypothetical protein